MAGANPETAAYRPLWVGRGGWGVEVREKGKQRNLKIVSVRTDPTPPPPPTHTHIHIHTHISAKGNPTPTFDPTFTCRDLRSHTGTLLATAPGTNVAHVHAYPAGHGSILP